MLFYPCLFLFRCNTEDIYCKPFVQEAIWYTGAMCKLYDIIYAPQFFPEHKYNSKKEIFLTTCKCINIAPAHLLFKFDEFYISKGVLKIPYTMSYTVVCLNLILIIRMKIIILYFYHLSYRDCLLTLLTFMFLYLQ